MPSYSKQDFECMAKTIFYEAGNQSPIGKEAVAYVVLKRLEFGFADDICGVVSQSKRVENKEVCQFSYFCKKLKPPKGNNWVESQRIAEKALTGQIDKSIIDTLGDALYFHADYVKPVWSKRFIKRVQIDQHIFYSEKG